MEGLTVARQEHTAGKQLEDWGPRPELHLNSS
jgi:hypothetical protein